MILGLLLALAARSAAAGVVVEEVQAGFAADRAGLKPGDVLLGWQRAAAPPANPEAAQGDLDSPLDLEDVEREQAPRGDLALSGERGGAPILCHLSPGAWRLTTRPWLDTGELGIHAEARRLVAAGEPESGFALWHDLALAFSGGGDHRRASWLWLTLARAAAEARKPDTAREAFQEALRSVDAPGGASLALIQGALGQFHENRSEWDLATAAYEGALAARRALSASSLREAWTLDRLGRVAGWRGDIAKSEDFLRRALALREALAPGSLDVAASLNSLGNLAGLRGDVAAAEDFQARALALREALAPESLDVAASLDAMGNVTSDRGDLARAEGFYGRALAIRERLAPRSLDVASSLQNLGVMALERGDYASAEEFQRRALAIRETLAPHSLSLSMSLQNLGAIASNRGDLAAAEDYLRRALALREELAPGGLHVAYALQSLGEVALLRGDLASAEESLRRALAIREKLSPDSLDLATALFVLGNVLLERGEPRSAEDQFRRALAINVARAPQSTTAAECLTGLGVAAWKSGDLARAREALGRARAIEERLALRSPITADTLAALGDVTLAGGDTAAAEAHYRDALQIQRAAAPGSAGEARACRSLGALERGRGEPERALGFYRCAIDALETQANTLGGSDEIRSSFVAHYARDYREALDLLVDLGRPEEAFHVLERYRARRFLSLLAERDLRFSADVPEELDRERRIANAEYDRLWGELARAEGEGARRGRQALEAARARQALVRDKVRAASPRLATLEYPEPLDLEGTRSALDPGSLLLSYSIGESRSYLFAVGPGPGEFSAKALHTDLKRLRERTLLFRDLLQGGALQVKQLQRASRELSDELLAPVGERIARAERVLIVADGPLHLVPFAALADPAIPSSFKYLIEAKPIHTVASATVFAELKKSRRPQRDVRLVAFGDPDYSAASPGDLQPLPATRAEVESLTRLYPGTSRAYLGPEATEEAAKGVGGTASLLHFACHGLTDEGSPLDSALALSIPDGRPAGRDNGLLQAWEVFEQVRIDADLVTLSACGTALGKESSGEGILGLSRAFQYAGARSVLASLWAVNDDSTADLMRRFYGHLKQGQGKDSALRAAQVELIRGRVFSHPARWAAFELIGDWK